MTWKQRRRKYVLYGIQSRKGKAIMKRGKAEEERRREVASVGNGDGTQDMVGHSSSSVSPFHVGEHKKTEHLLCLPRLPHFFAQVHLSFLLVSSRVAGYKNNIRKLSRYSVPGESRRNSPASLATNKNWAETNPRVRVGIYVHIWTNYDNNSILPFVCIIPKGTGDSFRHENTWIIAASLGSPCCLLQEACTGAVWWTIQRRFEAFLRVMVSEVRVTSNYLSYYWHEIENLSFCSNFDKENKVWFISSIVWQKTFLS